MRLVLLILVLLISSSWTRGELAFCDEGNQNGKPVQESSFGPVPYVIRNHRGSNASMQILDLLLLHTQEKLEAKEKWEMTGFKQEEMPSVFRYWNIGPLKLETEARRQGIDFKSGWRNALAFSHNRLQAFANFSNCSRVRHYAMFAPSKRTISSLVRLALPAQEQLGEIDLQVFASCANTATALHFDRHDNYFLQVLGRKRFYLIPPDYYAMLAFGPREHPWYRQSMLPNLEADVAMAQTGGNKFVVDLLPGDLLFVPRLWAHYVLTTADCVGMAMRRMERAGEDDELRKLPLPFEADWSIELKFAAVRYYLRQILTPEQTRILRANWKLAFPKHANLPKEEEKDKGMELLGEELRRKIERYASKLTFALEMFRFEYCEDVVLTMFATTQDGRLSVDFVINYL